MFARRFLRPPEHGTSIPSIVAEFNRADADRRELASVRFLGKVPQWRGRHRRDPSPWSGSVA